MTSVRREPQRTCLGCRQVQDQSAMIRFVRSPEGAVLVDLRGRLPGRGAYCCWQADCLEMTVDRRQFNRAFKQACQPVSTEALMEQVRAAVLKHMASLVGMARKSMQLLAGSSAVLEAMRKPERFAVILLATDTSRGVADKVRSKAARNNLECVESFSKIELGQLLGRAEHSVIGLYVGQLADAFQADLYKLRKLSGEC